MRLLPLCAASVLLAPLAGAHGGNYSGPGVTPPGSVSTGTKLGPADSVSGKPVLGPRKSNGPGGDNSRPAGATGGGRSSASSTASGATTGALQDDLTSWRYWWYYNSKPYLQLRRALDSREVVHGSDDYFLGSAAAHQPIGGVRPDRDLVHGVIVPELLGILESESSQQELTSALLSLARLEGDLAFEAKAEGEITGFLANGDSIVAEVAAISLGILGSDRSCFALSDLLADDDAGRKLRGGQAVGERIRAFAAYGLGQIGMRTARPEVRRYVVSKLQATFDRPDTAAFDVRVACLLSMGSVPLSADPLWEPASADTVTASACREAQVEWTLRVLGDEDVHPLIRAHAPTTLARLLEHAEREDLVELKARAVGVLLAELADESDAPRPVMQGAALALGQLGDSDGDGPDAAIRKALQRTFRRNADQQTRNFALISLAHAAGRPGREGSTAGAAPSLAALVAVLDTGATMQKPWAALAVGVLGRSLDDAGSARSDEPETALRKALQSTRTPELNSATALALGILRDLGSRELLIELLGQTSDTQVRGYAMIGLGLMQARGSLPKIEGILSESKYQPDLVQTAAVSLALMQDTELVPKLIEMLRSNASVPAQGAICYSLGNVGDVRAAQALVEMSADEELGATARSVAISALGLVADRYDLPWNTALSVNTNYRANPSSLSNPDIVGVLDIY